MLTAANFTDIKIQVKENAAEIISGWMPGSGAEKYVTSAYVTAVKPLDASKAIRDNVRHMPNPNECCPPVPMATDECGDADAVGC
jgi:hypothetical protein